MVEIKTHRDHPASMEERLHRRERNSGDVKHADAVVKGDKDMTTNIHRTRNQSYGEDHPGEGDINNRPRGPANTRGEI
jgi:hypothetical protein